jgi:hypothetical protein
MLSYWEFNLNEYYLLQNDGINFMLYKQFLSFKTMLKPSGNSSELKSKPASFCVLIHTMSIFFGTLTLCIWQAVLSSRHLYMLSKIMINNNELNKN